MSRGSSVRSLTVMGTGRHQTIKVGSHHWRVTDGVLFRDDRDSLRLADVTRCRYKVAKRHFALTVGTLEQQFSIGGLPRDNMRTICDRVLHGIAHYSPAVEVRMQTGGWLRVLDIRADPIAMAAAIRRDPRHPERFLR